MLFDGGQESLDIFVLHLVELLQFAGRGDSESIPDERRSDAISLSRSVGANLFDFFLRLELRC